MNDREADLAMKKEEKREKYIKKGVENSKKGIKEILH